jgi:hypothetical protein
VMSRERNAVDGDEIAVADDEILDQHRGDHRAHATGSAAALEIATVARRAHR